MTWTSVFTPEIWPTTAVILLMLFLAGYSWRRRSVPGALPFMLGSLFTSLVIVGVLMVTLTFDPESRDFWLRFRLAWTLPASTAITCFVLEYASPGRWLTRRRLGLLSILPLFFLFYFLGGGYVFLGPAAFQVGGAITPSSDPTGLFFILYNLALTLVNLGVFAWLFIRSPQHRWPVVLMASAAIYITASSSGYGPAPDARSSISPVFILPFVTYAIALFGFRIFDPVMLASQTAIDQLSAGLFVLDPQGKVVNVNLLAEHMLNLPEGKSKGKNFDKIIPASLQQRLNQSRGAESKVIEFSLAERSAAAPAVRDYTLTPLPLKDWHGLEVGRLLLLRDVTEPKRVREKEKQEHLLLAVLEERERLARELHDSLGQVLSYASLQVETAEQLSLEGQGQAAAAQLNRLGSVIRDAHADLREYILNLHSTSSLEQPFFPTVKQYLDGFTRSYDIQTMLAVAPGLEQCNLPPDRRLQLFRILQEAASNTRKHGCAHQLQVTFRLEGGWLGMTIQDDGCGFTPEEAAPSAGAHYGLQFMRERAETLGGILRITSAPGSGTRVELTIPIQEA